jgi:uncharacterized protein YllA (UPF0747 family)
VPDFLAWLERSPLSFSTSALLRPLLQDALFPTVAYVAGPGEARYLEQVHPLHARLGVPMPAIVPRARFVVTDAGCRRRLSALGLTAADLQQPEERLLARLAPRDAATSGGRLREELLAPLLQRLDALAPDLTALGPDVADAVERTRQHVTVGVEKLAGRVERAQHRRDATLTERLAYLRRRLAPTGHPQERVLTFPHFAAQIGPRAFKEAVMGAITSDRALREIALSP